MKLACLGSSTTAAKGAFKWIHELEQRPRNSRIQFLNFGVGGDLAFNALQRVPDVLASRPDRVLVLIGANDVLARVLPRFARLVKRWKRLPRDPSREWFREHLDAIVNRLRAGSRARVALCSLGPIGEDPNSPEPVQRQLNEGIADYSAIIRETAQRYSLDYVPFHERLHEQIVASPGRAFTSFRLLSF
jgi:lysophospholipase L1-like esterase